MDDPALLPTHVSCVGNPAGMASLIMALNTISNIYTEIANYVAESADAVLSAYKNSKYILLKAVCFWSVVFNPPNIVVSSFILCRI
jgi:hypothetical protein